MDQALRKTSKGDHKCFVGLLRGRLNKRPDHLQYSGIFDIEKNLETFRQMFDLNELETEICLFLFILSTYEEAESFFEYHLKCSRFARRNYLGTIQCYRCRNVCPVCFCNVCTLEEDDLIRTGNLPSENPMFHLTRAVHMAGRCIDCNLCTEVCPSEIPLRTLYKKVGEIIHDDFGYVTGQLGGEKSPLNILGPDPGHTSAND